MIPRPSSVSLSYMKISEVAVDGYERVARALDDETGLHAIIAVHDTTLGPALGGLRMWPYESEEAGLTDVLRLSRGMTFKSAIAHTGLGGGKAVILGDPKKIKSEALYRAMGRFIDNFDGSYITAEDVNTKIEDLEHIRKETRYVTGLSRESGSSGNPSPYTAYGCFLGVEACVEHVFGSPSLEGRKIAMQGVGAVGAPLAKHLIDAGATVHATDLRRDRLEKLADEIGLVPATEGSTLTMECDILVPCALGGILNDDTIPGLGCKIIAGCANNQLHTRAHGDKLRERGILYAPDYVINAGGIINVGCELRPGGYDEKLAHDMIRRIPDALREVFEISEKHDISTADAAFRLAQKILAEGKSK